MYAHNTIIYCQVLIHGASGRVVPVCMYERPPGVLSNDVYSFKVACSYITVIQTIGHLYNVVKIKLY